ncbi:LysE family translocator [Kurthia huakuii]|uniref:LysE family translocator n=1 Tax=Kurthia huakuii TaxID=1421019 RepID=UPI00049645FF|nr:LysE family translocator [Kurthia huakuii]
MENIGVFLIMSLLLILVPGPDSGLVIQNSIVHGKKAGMKTVLGSVSGLFIHTAAAVLGLSALIVKSAWLFTILKWVGAAYLIYIGISSLRTVLRKEEPAAMTKAKKQKSFYLQGFITCAANPKVAVFFLTFLPQFVNDTMNHMLQFSLMGLAYGVMTIIVFTLYVVLIEAFSRWLKKPVVQKALQGTTGAVLVTFGIRLAFESQP